MLRVDDGVEPRRDLGRGCPRTRLAFGGLAREHAVGRVRPHRRTGVGWLEVPGVVPAVRALAADDVGERPADRPLAAARIGVLRSGESGERPWRSQRVARPSHASAGTAGPSPVGAGDRRSRPTADAADRRRPRESFEDRDRRRSGARRPPRRLVASATGARAPRRRRPAGRRRARQRSGRASPIRQDASGDGWDGRQSISGSCIGQAYRPSASICPMTGRGPRRRPAGLLAARSSTGSRPRRRPPSSPPGSTRTPDPATSSPTSFGRGGWVARAAIDRQRRARLARVEPAHADARRGRPAAARRPPSRRRVPGPGRVAAPRVEPEGVDRRPVRDPLRDVRPDARRRRGHLGGRRRGGDRRPDAGRSPGTTAARSAATSAAGPSSARRRSTPTTCAGRRPTSAPTRCAAILLARFPTIDGAERLPDELLDLHTARQLVGLGAILERIEGDLRAAPVLAALRLALLHAILPASRLATGPGRTAALRVASGHVRLPSGDAVARAQPVARLRGRLPDRPRLRPAARRRTRSARSRRGSARTCAASARGRATAVARPGRPGRPASPCATTRTPTAGRRPTPARPARPRPAAAAPEPRPAGGRVPRRRPGCSAARRPRCCRSTRWPVASLRARGAGRRRRSGAALAAVEPAHGPRRPRRPARRRRSGGARGGRPRRAPRPAIGCSARGSPTPTRTAPAIVELLPPGGRLPPGARTRANVGLEPLPGGAGDPDVVPGRGLFAPPERVRRPAVLGGRGGPDRDRDRGRDAPGPRRAGPLRAAPRRDPRRARPGGPAPAAGRLRH